MSGEFGPVVAMPPERSGEVARLLARAFAEETHFACLLGDRRRRALEHVMRMQVADAHAIRADRAVAPGTRSASHGGLVDAMLDAEGRVVAAAVWLPPGAWPMSAGRVLRSIPHLARVAVSASPSAAWRLMRFGQRSSPGHPAEPHWYLTAFGVAPELASRGLGSSLLRHGLDRADRDGRAAFLETQEAATASWYAGHGFRSVAEPLDFPGFSSRRMLRPARGDGPRR